MKNKVLFIASMITITLVITAIFTNNIIASSKTYSWGSSGETVKLIQQKLIRWGYMSGNADGNYGQQTWTAVKKFQQKNGLKVDGVVGKATLEKLGINEAVQTSSSNGGSNNGHESDVRLLAAAIHGEARGEPYEGQVAVGAVIMNRTRHPSFPNTISGVIYQPGAFDAVKDGQINLTPNETSIRAARDAMNGWDPTDGAIYYWNPVTATSKWIWSVPISKTIGKHVFGTK